jgi:hypothetical protein
LLTVNEFRVVFFVLKEAVFKVAVTDRWWRRWPEVMLQPAQKCHQSFKKQPIFTN